MPATVIIRRRNAGGGVPYDSHSFVRFSGNVTSHARPKRNTSGGKREGKRKPQQKPAFPSLSPDRRPSPLSASQTSPHPVGSHPPFGFPLWTLFSLTPSFLPFAGFCFIPGMHAKVGYRTGYLCREAVFVGTAFGGPQDTITERRAARGSPYTAWMTSETYSYFFLYIFSLYFL